MEVLRSLLFVPGNRSRMIEKARSLPADALILDMEDSVPFQEKASARDIVRQAIPGLPLAGQTLFVRVNGWATGLTEADLEGVVVPGVEGVSLPKAEAREDVERLAQALDRLEKARGLARGLIKVIPWVETARGLLRAFELAAAPRVVGIAFGADDFTRDMGVERTKEGQEQLFPRAMIAVAARAAGVLALDTPYVDFTDQEGLVRDSRLARQLGFQGKFLIHPSQVEAVNRVFMPSPEEVERARKEVAAFEAAEAQGFASTSFEGRMIDVAGVERARKLLRMAEAIARKEGGK